MLNCRVTKHSFLLVLLSLSILLPAQAQTSFVLSGRTLDWVDEPVVGVRVKIVSGDGVVAETVSGSGGEYRVAGLPRGQKLTAEFRRSGYRRNPTLEDVLEEGETCQLDVRLWKRAENGEYYERVVEAVRARAPEKDLLTAELTMLRALELDSEETKHLEGELGRQYPITVLNASLAAAGWVDAPRLAPQRKDPAHSVKVSIAVLEIKNKADNQYWWHGGGEAAQDVFIAELVKSQKFSVVERERLEAIMQEKGLVLSGDVSAQSAMQIGQLLGVQYLLAGAVTEYGEDSAEGGAPSVGGLPSFRFGKKNFTAAINARVFNVSTGEIVWADDASHSDSAVKVRVGGIGGGKDDQRQFDKVMKPAIQDLVASLKAADL